MLNYWQPGYEWMGHGLQGHWCPSFAHNQLQSPDVSGFGNHGQLLNFANNGNNALVTSGGQLALDFDGVNDRVTTTSVSTTMSTGFTVNFWLKARNTGGMILGNNSNNVNHIRLFGTTTATSLRVAVGTYTFDLTASSRNTQDWSAITVVGLGTTVAWYYNGLLVQSATNAAASSGGMNVNTIGTGASSPLFFDGQLDDIRIYSRPWTAQEILATYQADRGGGMGYQPPLRRSYAALLGALVLACDTGNYTLSGQSAGLFASRSLAADQAQYILSGNAANTLASRLLSSDPATYNATGNDAATLCARLLDGGAAAYALTGTDAGLIANRKLTADQAICFLAGNNAELLRTIKLNAGSMQLQLDNFAASLLAGRKISADGAQYLLVVSDANLTSSASGVAPYYYLFMMRGPQ